MANPIIPPDASAALVSANRVTPDWYQFLRLFSGAFNATSSVSAVADLPSATKVGIGNRRFVNDATGPVFGSAVVGGGAALTPVYSDGTSWIVG